MADTVSSYSHCVVVITETHMQPTDSVLRSITPLGCKLCHRPHAYGLGGGCWLCLKS